MSATIFITNSFQGVFNRIANSSARAVMTIDDRDNVTISNQVESGMFGNYHETGSFHGKVVGRDNQKVTIVADSGSERRCVEIHKSGNVRFARLYQSGMFGSYYEDERSVEWGKMVDGKEISVSRQIQSAFGI